MSMEQFETIDEDAGNELYESLKAEVVEEFNLNDNEIKKC